MKTLRFLKISALIQFLYAIYCAASLILLYVNTGLGIISSYLWLFNPIGPVCLAKGLSVYGKEKKIPEEKELIGKKWILIILMFIFTFAVWLISGCLMAEITGGA